MTAHLRHIKRGAGLLALLLALPAGAQSTVTVFEFYNTTLDHYFRTADAGEAGGIDNGAAGPGWIRTGDNFLAYPANSFPTGAVPVCRFYGSVSPGPNSHFYTASQEECDGLKALQASTPATQKRWNYEGLAFAIFPSSGTPCSGGLNPVYRLYNDGHARGEDSNHRYTTSQTEYARLQAAGWTGEGVVMCATTEGSMVPVNPPPPANPPPGSSATAVGVPTSSAVSMTIGAGGGSVSAADGKLTVIVPAGALASDTAISIQPLTNRAHGKIGAAYRLTPDGQTFAQPVVLKFSYADQDLAGSDPEILGAAFQTAAGYWQWLGTPIIDSAAKTVSISATHFTDFSLVQGYRLQPLSATLKVNGSLALQVAFCYPATDSDLNPLGLSCDTAASQVEVAAPFVISEWSVNGVLGGGGATGTVSGNGPSATYRAPATEPKPNTVAVSARVNLGARGKTLVVSNVTITEDSWTGTASFKDDVDTASAEITWTLVSTENNIGIYTATGTGTIAYYDARSPGTTCSYPPTSGSLAGTLGSGILVVDFNNTPPTYHGAALAGPWPATHTCTTSSGTYTTIDMMGSAVFGGSKGPDGGEAAGSVTVPLNPDAPMTIEGSDTDGMGGIYNWKFTRNP